MTEMWNLSRRALVSIIGVIVVVATAGGVYYVRHVHVPQHAAWLAGVRARGHLKVIADPGWRHSERRWQTAVAKALKRENVAPVAHSLLLGKAPEGIAVQVSPEGPDTPTAPEPPPELRDLSEESLEGSRVASGPLAAALYGQGRFGFDPCILMIKYGSRGSAPTIKRQLIDRYQLDDSTLVISRGGKALLIFVEAWYKGRSVDGDSVYIYREELELSEEGLGAVDSYWREQGKEIHVRRYRPSRPELSCLWRIDTKAGKVEVISRDPSIWGWPLLPSPDGAFLVSGRLPLRVPYAVIRSPITLVDCRDGSVHDLTWRDHGSYSDCPLAWSAEVPGRLYFITWGHTLWQLDIDLSMPGPDE